MQEPSAAELLIRGAAAGVFLLVALRVGSGGGTPARITGAAFSLAAAGHAVTQLWPVLDGLGPVRDLLWVISVGGAGLFWAFAVELFGDHRRLAAIRFAPALALLAIAAVGRWFDPNFRPIWVVYNAIGAILMLHVLWVVAKGWRGDLVEARRRLRGPLLVVAALYTLILAAVQAAELYLGPSGLSMLAAVLLLAMALGSGTIFLREDADLLGPSARGPARRVTPLDEPLLRRLTDALEREQVWREEGLTIGALAQRLGVAEHRLRRLINDGLGYRNFAAFLNEHRIEAAKVALSDPANARAAISTIAFDVGFSSLAPFNRAFREMVGQTPSDWRRQS